MNIKFPVRLVDDKFLVGADHELISKLPDATEEEREEIVRTMNTGAAAQDLLKALEDADELITQLMPGVKYIVLQDYGFLNQTLLNNKAAIAKAKGEAK